MTLAQKNCAHHEHTTTVISNFCIKIIDVYQYLTKKNYYIIKYILIIDKKNAFLVWKKLEKIIS
jgi:hypothetical protein